MMELAEWRDLKRAASISHRQRVASLYERVNAIFDQEVIADKSSEWDSDIDLSEYPLKVGDFIDFKYFFRVSQMTNGLCTD